MARNDLTRWSANVGKEGNPTLKIDQEYHLGREFWIPQNVSKLSPNRIGVN
jgi:hypothetical protein